MRVRNFSFVFGSAAGLFIPGIAHVQTIDTQKVLDQITNTADKICNVVLNRGETNSKEVKGEVRAQLNGLASKLADIGVSGSDNINNEAYQNVLRTDLSATLKDNAACKLKVFDTLQIKLLPPQPPQREQLPSRIQETLEPVKQTVETEPTDVRRHFGMDAPGNDRGSWIRNVGSVDDCESICLADPGCAGYTYNTRRSTCIPKNRIGSLVQHNEQPVTGEFLGRAGRSISLAVTRLSNMDAPGSDIRWVRGVGSVDQCEGLCLAESNCAGYTYNIAKFICIPKASVVSVMPSRDPAITGIVRARNSAR